MHWKLSITLSILFAALLSLFLLFAVFLERLIPYIVDLEEVKDNLEEGIQDSTGIRAEIQELSIDLTLFEGIRILFDNNVLFDPEDIQVVDAGNVVVNIRYLPLLRGKTSISHIAFNNIEVYIGERSFLFRLKRPEAPSRRVFLEDARIAFNNYQILVDRYFDGTNRYFLRGESLFLSNIRSERPLIFSGGGTGFFGIHDPDQLIGEFQLYIRADQELIDKPRLDWRDVQRFVLQLKQVQLPTLSNILQTYGVEVAATGEVRQLAFDYQGDSRFPSLEIRGQTPTRTHVRLYEYDFRFNPGTLFFTTQLDLAPEQRIAQLKQLQLVLANPDFHARVQGNVLLKTPFEESNLDLRLVTSWLSLSGLELLPPLTPWQKRILASLAGDFATDLAIRGSPLSPEFQGDVHLRRTSIRSPQTQALLVDNLNGTIRILSPGRFRIPSLQGIVANGFFRMEDRLDLQNNTINSSVTVQNLDLRQLRELLLLFLPDGNFLSQIQIFGQASSRLRIQGEIRNPLLSGYTDLIEAGMQARDAQLPMIRRVTGRLLFRNRSVQSEQISALIGDQPITASGMYNWQTTGMNLVLQSDSVNLGQAQQIAQTVLRALGNPIALLERFDFLGNAGINLRLQGHWPDLSIQGQLRLFNAQVLDRLTRLGLFRLFALINFSDGSVELVRLIGQLEETPLSIRGRIYNRYQQLALNFIAPDVDLARIEPLLSFFVPDFSRQMDIMGRAGFRLNLAGNIRSPDLTGVVQLRNVDLTYRPRAITLQDLTGALRITPETIRLLRIRGFLQGIPWVMNGFLRKDRAGYRLNVEADNVPLTLLQRLIADFAPDVAAHFRQVGIRAGLADLALTFSSALPLGVGGNVTLRNILAIPPALDLPIRIARLQYRIETGRLEIPQSPIQIGALPFTATGFATGRDYQIRLVSQTMPVAFLRDQKALLERLLPVKLPALYNTAGSFQVIAFISPLFREALVDFTHAGASMQELKYPLYDINGLLRIVAGQRIQLSTDNLNLRYANSPATLSLRFNPGGDLDLQGFGSLSPLLLNDLLGTLDTPLLIRAAVPFDIRILGTLGQLAGHGAGNNLFLFSNLNLATVYTNHNARAPQPVIPSGEADPFTVHLALHLLRDTLDIRNIRLWIERGSSISLAGQVQSLFDPQQRSVTLSLATEPVLNLEAISRHFGERLLEGGLYGTIGARLFYRSNGHPGRLDGHVTLNQVRIPFLWIEDLRGRIFFDGLTAFLGIERLKLPGVDIGFTAFLPQLDRSPLPVINFRAQGEQFIVDLFRDWIREVVRERVRNRLLARWLAPGRGPAGLPFEIRDGTIRLAEAILNNIILINYTSLIRIYPTGAFELGSAQAEVAGGLVQGDFAMNPAENNRMLVRLRIIKAKANAVSRILLNMSNQIFGDLSGVIHFATEGRTRDEMLANANGYASLVIEEGRLPSIARIENLMLAASAVSGALANLNLANLFRLATRYDTEYFATLSGTFNVVQGRAFTNNLFVNGEYLDFRVSGNLRLLDGYADLLVRGEMERRIGGVLGIVSDSLLGRIFRVALPLRRVLGLLENGRPTLGDIPALISTALSIPQVLELIRGDFELDLKSVSGIFGVLAIVQFFRFIPPVHSLINRIPGIGYVPGFGIPIGEDALAFEVRILGPITDPGSIQDFRWVRQ